MDVAPRVFSKGDVHLEIGFGRGEFLEHLAYKGVNTVGVEVSNEAIEKALKRLQGKDNVTIVKSEGLYFLKYLTPPASLEAVFTIFPDPFIKHEHKRMVNKTFLELLRVKLKKGGIFYFITDWEDYYTEVREVLSKVKGFKKVDISFTFETRFLRKWRRKGRRFYELCLENTWNEPENFSYPPKDVSVDVKASSEPTPFLEVEDGWVFKVEEVFRGRDDYIMRTLVKEKGAPEIKQFLKLSGETISLFPLGHELAVPPVVKLIEKIKERLEHGHKRS